MTVFRQASWPFLYYIVERHDRKSTTRQKKNLTQRLTRGSRCTITAISEGLCITRQGARKHLQVLAGARVIALQPEGRDVLFSLEPESLDQARLFIAEIERRWDARLDALRKFVEE